MSANRPTSLGALRALGYQPRTVKRELADNLLARLRSGEPSLPGIVGFEDTVGPQVERALLAGHDLVLLGERGQGKTRLIRSLIGLLDEWIPVVAGCQVNDDPLQPVCAQCRRLAAQAGDDLPIAWRHRSERFGEKLATPDTSVGDLIGDVDPVKVAEGRALGDLETIHFGLVPRTNRGIFAVNELPDLAERIQVALLNVLEERDIQVRGYTLRLPLDMLVVASANPEDYTNRGRIVTPLKDRIGSVIRTHYPQTLDEAITIVTQNANLQRNDSGVQVELPRYMHEILEEFVRLARTSPHINQASGVSVRCSIANAENVVSSAERRGITLGEARVVARMDDLAFITASSRGKIELMLAEGDTAEDKLIGALLGEAVKNVFNRYAELSAYDDIATQFKGGVTLQVGDEIPAATMLENYGHLKGLAKAAATLAGELGLDPKDPAATASAGEFLLEALYVNNRLSKTNIKGKTFFRK